MADDQEGYKEETLNGENYSELLFGDDDNTLGGCFNFTSSSPRMLCFGDYTKTCADNPFVESCSINSPAKIQKSGVTCSSTGDSPSACSSSNSKNNKSDKKRNGAEKESVEKTKTVPAGNQRNCKRTKAENSNVTGHAKVKKEKLGERITALQQLVSPFGKTDTASVLHEAMGYIRFLHDQVQVLCSPYLQRLSPSLREGGENGEMEGSRKEAMLRSKGLCLVPIELTLHVADTTLNGADFWSPAAMTNNITRLNSNQ
ncbi:PREDICTED: transcription factor bHLH113 [Nicotiana attenuata]|uniref:Transcription factor bhlh113 n=1 Tax=Nicotiana attenuata TaxID=49451 RepID=A0A314KST8_NICAT|nr:PREDICTED: transcription factor bHLH113 [Nicotiana attenuata]OIT32392.1 transcription factor bhlh113 [Nicotiana attenuata]